MNTVDEDVMIMENCSDDEIVKKVKKIHKVMCHPRLETMLQFFKDSSENKEKVLKTVKEVSASCDICNGLNEKNHAVVDFMMAKLQADDPNLNNQQALNYALHAKNMETTSKGFSAFQIVYGSNPKIPGITESNPASLNENFVSLDVKVHLKRIHNARLAFRMADNDDRIKRALKSKINTSDEIPVETGDSVYFKEVDKLEWLGPAKVVGSEGKVIYLKYGNKLRRIHSSRVI